MTLSWDPDDQRVVIEVFPFNEPAVVTPEQLEDLDEEEFEASPTRSSSCGSSRVPARAFVKRASRSSRPAAPAAPSAGTRSTPTVICACGPTASGDGDP